jgi:hypothetical protein
MKAVFAGLFCMISLSSAIAHAESVLVKSLSDGSEVLRTQYVIEPSLGRAWVQIEYWPSIPSNDTSLIETTVPRLSYDVASSQIVFQGSGGAVVCANVTESENGKKLLIAPTGACEFSASRENRAYDTGMRIEALTSLNVYFDAK